MKKILVIMLIAVMLCLSSCGKKQVSSQQSVELQPLQEKVIEGANEAAPKEDDNSIGRMAFYPNSNESMYALAGTNCFTVYFEKKRVKVGEGKIGLYDGYDNTLYSSIDASDTKRYDITSGEMDDVGKSLTGWQDGTKIDLYFDKTFKPGGKYYILIDEGFFELGQIKSKAQVNPSWISFGTKQYGLDLGSTEIDRTYSVSDTVLFDVLVDGDEAQTFAFTEYDPSFIIATPERATSDTTVSLQLIQGGSPSIKVGFYKEGKEVDSISLCFSVDGPTLNGDVVNSDVPTDGASAESSATEDASSSASSVETYPDGTPVDPPYPGGVPR